MKNQNSTKSKTNVLQESSHNKDNAIHFFQAFSSVFSCKSFLGICVLFLFVEFSFDIIKFCVPMIGEKNSVDTSLIGMASSAYFLTFTLSQVPINHFLSRLRTKRALFLMGILSILTCLVFFLNTSFITVIIGMGIAGITIGNLFTYCTVVASEYAPGANRGLYLGIFNCIMPLTDICSPVITALLFGVGLRLPFAISLALLCVFTILASKQK